MSDQNTPRAPAVNLSRALGGSVFDDAAHDLRLALRGLRRRPAFTVVAATTIAVGVGATTAMLSIANAVLLRPAPVAEPDRMVSIWQLGGGHVMESMEGRLLPYTRYEEYVDGTGDVFVGLAAHRYEHLSVVTDVGAVAVDGFVTTGNYFSLLGLAPGAGRLYGDDDEASVVVSDRLWRSRFGADPTLVGRTLSIDSRPFVVTGVAPPDFVGTMSGFTGDVWVPAGAYWRLTGITGSATSVVPIGRLRPGIDRALAQERVDDFAKATTAERPNQAIRGARLEALSWRTDLVGTLRLGLTVMTGAAVLTLLIACMNIAGMMLARCYDRYREVAVRLAIGAGRGRLVRQMLMESVLLALIGGAGGILLATVGTAALASVEFPINATITFDVTPDRTVLSLCLAIAALTGIVFGLGPALRSSSVDLTTSLKEGAHGASHSRRRNVFVAGQLALCTLLLVTSGLFVRSLRAVADVELGFEPAGVLVATLDVGSHGYDESRGRAFYGELLERIRQLPGVESAGLARFVLLGGSNASDRATATDGGDDPPATNASENTVDPQYFRTMGVELLAGRSFTPEDEAGTPGVAVVNEALADRLWPDQDPIGRRFRAHDTNHEVIGVVRDGVYAFVFDPQRSFSFYPFSQRYTPSMSLHVRSGLDPAALGSDIIEIVRDLDPNVAVEGIRTMSEVVSSNRFMQSFVASLTTLFALIGLLLGAVGVYGLLAVQVAQRGREFGIRMALGAKARDVLLLVVRRGATVALVGCTLGIALSVGLGRFLASLLYEVRPLDVPTLVAVPVILITVAVLASAVPAQRATRTSPIVTLREE